MQAGCSVLGECNVLYRLLRLFMLNAHASQWHRTKATLAIEQIFQEACSARQRHIIQYRM